MMGDLHTLVVPVWLHHNSNEHNKILVYALLDCQSDACFVKENALKRMRVSGSQEHLKVDAIAGEHIFPCTKISGLVVHGFRGHQHIDLPLTYSREDIHAEGTQISQPETNMAIFSKNL